MKTESTVGARLWQLLLVAALGLIGLAVYLQWQQGIAYPDAIDRDDPVAAAAVLDRLALLGRSSAERRFEVARTHERARAFGAAIRNQTLGLALEPSGAQFAALARLRLLDRDPEAAIRAWTEGYAVSHDPRYLHRAVRTLLGMNEPERAVRIFQRVLRAPEIDASLYLRLARISPQFASEETQLYLLRQALRLQRTNRTLQNDLAWLIATTADDALRDPDEAIRLSVASMEGFEDRDPNHLDTLAAAYGAAGRFEEAVAAAEEAASLTADDPAFGDEIALRLELYRAGQPYRQPPRPARRPSPTPR